MPERDPNESYVERTRETVNPESYGDGLPGHATVIVGFDEQGEHRRTTLRIPVWMNASMLYDAAVSLCVAAKQIPPGAPWDAAGIPPPPPFNSTKACAAILREAAQRLEHTRTADADAVADAVSAGDGPIASILRNDKVPQ